MTEQPGIGVATNEPPVTITPAAPRKRVARKRVPVDPTALERKYQDELDLLLRRAMAVGIPPEKLLAKASVQRGVGMFERFTDTFFNALEGKKR